MIALSASLSTCKGSNKSRLQAASHHQQSQNQGCDLVKKQRVEEIGKKRKHGILTIAFVVEVSYGRMIHLLDMRVKKIIIHNIKADAPLASRCLLTPNHHRILRPLHI